MSDPAGPEPAPSEAPEKAPLPRAGRLRALPRRLSLSRTAFVLWVALVTVLLVSVAFRATTEVGPGRIQVRVQPSTSGRTELAIPPLGAVRATTHRAPVALEVELREVDVLGALDPGDHRGSPRECLEAGQVEPVG